MPRELTNADGFKIVEATHVDHNVGNTSDNTDRIELNRWQNYGKDRLYLNGPMGGYLDLQTETYSPEETGAYVRTQTDVDGDTITITVSKRSDWKSTIVLRVTGGCDGDDSTEEEDGDSDTFDAQALVDSVLAGEGGEEEEVDEDAENDREGGDEVDRGEALVTDGGEAITRAESGSEGQEIFEMLDEGDLFRLNDSRLFRVLDNRKFREDDSEMEMLGTDVGQRRIRARRVRPGDVRPSGVSYFLAPKANSHYSIVQVHASGPDDPWETIELVEEWELRAMELTVNGGVPERRAEVVALVEDGKTHAEAKEILGLNNRSNVGTMVSDYREQLKEAEWLAENGARV